MKKRCVECEQKIAAMPLNDRIAIDKAKRRLEKKPPCKCGYACDKCKNGTCHCEGND